MAPPGGNRLEEPTPTEPLEPPPPPPPSPLRNAVGLAVPVLRAALYLIVYVLLQYAEIVAVTALARLVGGSLFGRGGIGSSSEIFLAFTVLTLPPQLVVTWLFVR